MRKVQKQKKPSFLVARTRLRKTRYEIKFKLEQKRRSFLDNYLKVFRRCASTIDGYLNARGNRELGMVFAEKIFDRETTSGKFLFSQFKKDELSGLIKDPAIYIDFLVKRGPKGCVAAKQAINDLRRVINEESKIRRAIAREYYTTRQELGKKVNLSSEKKSMQTEIISEAYHRSVALSSFIGS